MAMGENYVTVLGTIVISALAIGAAVGADALVGERVADAGSAPGVTVAMSDDFCTVMGQLNTYYAARSAESGVLDGTIDLTAGEDPALLAAIQKQADPLQKITAAMSVYMGHGAEVVADATVAEDLRTLSAFTKAQGAALAQVSRDATSVEGFMIAAMGASLDPAAKPTAGEADATRNKIRDYVTTECAIDLSAVVGAEASGGASGPSTSSGGSSDPSTSSGNGAKDDASKLGEEISAVFVDWKKGDALPEVSLSDGTYGVSLTTKSDAGISVSSSAFGAASSKPAIVDQSITGPLDWCVSVTDKSVSPATTYRSSATGGVEEGTCAALDAAA